MDRSKPASSGRKEAVAFPKSLGEDEILFGQLLLRKGWVTPEQVREALEEQARARSEGRGTLRLGDVLVRKGVLPLDQVVEILRLREQILTLVCTSCGAMVRTMEYDPRRKYACRWAGKDGRVCGGRLRLTSHTSRAQHASRAVTAQFRDMPEEVRKAAADPRRVFGKYIFVRELGRGGMGAVYQAWDTTLARTVAVKVMLDEGLDEHDLERFHREAQMAGALAHPNIVPVYEIGEVDGGHYLAMQYIEGKPPIGRRLPWKDACRIIRDVVRALDEAHRHNVVHRDIKPHNILVDASGKPYLTDFGLAKSMKGANTLTQTGVVLGTPSYMAPEQARGERHRVGKRSDIYSLGATLYELITGRPPFSGANPYQTMAKVVNSDPLPPSRLVANLPKDVDTVVLKAMEKEPERRYATAGEFAEDLDRLLRDEPVRARPASFTHRLRRKLRRNRAVLLPVAAAVVVLIAGATYAGVRAIRERQQFRALVAQADDLFARQKWQEALECYGRAAGFREDDPHVRGRIAECRSRIAEAEALARQGEARAREELERRRRDEEEARRRREKAQGSFEQGYGILQEAERDFYRPGADLVRTRERVAEAIRMLLDAIGTYDAAADYWYHLGRAHALRQEFEPAEEAFSGAIRRKPDSVLALLERGRLYLSRYIEERLHAGWNIGPSVEERIGPWLRKAAEDFRAAREAGAGEQEAAFLDAALAFAGARWEECFAKCEEILAQHPEREDVWKLYGDAMHFGAPVGETIPAEGTRERRMIEEAIRFYSEALRRRTNYYEALIMRGYEYELLGEQEMARADFERALALRPGDPLGLWFRGSLALRGVTGMGRTPESLTPGERARVDEALAYFRQGLQAKSDSYILESQTASALGMAGDWEEALAHARRAAGINPDFWFAHYLIGTIESRLGRLAEAIPSLQTASRMAPNNPSVWFNFGVVSYTAGRFDIARPALQRALDLGHPSAPRIRELLDRMGPGE
jgi:tetratricopeptide (TPR) repeat protein/predicted Ser/Thr protein kinase